MSSADSRIETLHLVAGRPCLDLVNTVSWRGDPDRREEHLRTVADAMTWARRAQVVSSDEAEHLHRTLDRAAGGRLLRELRALRELVADDLVRPRPPRMDRLEEAVHDAVAHSRLVPSGQGHHWGVVELDARTVPRRLALDVLDLLETPHGRLASCADEACGWVFLDSSKAGTRRWCRSAYCGKRERVRRHYRQRAGHGRPAG